MTTTVAPPITRRYDFCLLYDVSRGNPNGDPDAGNAPRIDPETGRGLVSDVCLKRKIRNYITLVKGGTESSNPQPGYDIYVKERAVLNRQHDLAYEALGISKDEKDSKKKVANQDNARKWMCQTFFDIRMFGAVMTTGTNCGQVRGPIQIGFSTSIDPIVALEQTITRMAVTTEGEAEKQGGGNRAMGRKDIIPYALYRVHGFVNPHLAAQTGFNEDDLALLWKSLEQMFEFDRSASRGEMTARNLFVFEHDSPLGNARAQELFDRIHVELKQRDKPPRAFDDYDVRVSGEALPAGVTLDTKF